MSPALPVSPATVLQYVVLSLLAYILAGAPLLEMLAQGGGEAQTAVSGARSRFEEQDGVADGLIVPDAGVVCGEHAYRGVYVLSREPLVVYIEGFLGAGEADEVVELSTPLFTPSTIWTSGTETLDPSIRDSHKAPLPLTRTISCIEHRARALQGWRPHVYTEKLWAQRYGPGGHYTYHYDWASVSAGHGRVSSFMVWVRSNCTGGGTHFPRLKMPGGGEWCRFVECGGEREGVVFKPVQGNAVFWENVRADGTGVEESLHAGLPVLSGEKIGLNIWSWLMEGHVPGKRGE